MKVVIFCGGLGVRMGEATQRTPKPMIEIGGRPILWHIMRYYAEWGYNDFILCLGYRGEVVKEYFLTYNEALFNDFVLERNGGSTKLELLSRDVGEWRVTFVDTGADATIAERLKVVGPRLGDDDVFLATYGDGLTDAPLPEVIDAFKECKKTAMFLSVRPEFNAHLVTSGSDGTVLSVEDMSRSQIRINGGFFVFKREILDLIEPGDELSRRRSRSSSRETHRGVPVRRVLRADGHDQGLAAPRGPARVGSCTLAQSISRHAESPPD